MPEAAPFKVEEENSNKKLVDAPFKVERENANKKLADAPFKVKREDSNKMHHLRWNKKIGTRCWLMHHLK